MKRASSMYRNGPRASSGSLICCCWQDGGADALSDSAAGGNVTGCLELLAPEADADTPVLPTVEETEGEMRLDLIARVRQEIASGTYDTPEKLAIALDRLLARFEGRC